MRPSSSGWSVSSREGREELLCFLPREGRDERQKLPFGMSQESGMGRFALIPAWTHAKEGFQNSQALTSCHRVKKKSYSLFFHSMQSKACRDYSENVGFFCKYVFKILNTDD